MKKLRMKGIRAAAAATRNCDYTCAHIQIEYDPEWDIVSAYTPGPYGYFEPDNDWNIVLHIYAPSTMKSLRDMIERRLRIEGE